MEVLPSVPQIPLQAHAPCLPPHPLAKFLDPPLLPVCNMQLQLYRHPLGRPSHGQTYGLKPLTFRHGKTGNPNQNHKSGHTLILILTVLCQTATFPRSNKHQRKWQFLLAKECNNQTSSPDRMQTGPAEVASVLQCLVAHLSSVSTVAKQLPLFCKTS